MHGLTLDFCDAPPIHRTTTHWGEGTFRLFSVASPFPPQAMPRGRALYPPSSSESDGLPPLSLASSQSHRMPFGWLANDVHFHGGTDFAPRAGHDDASTQQVTAFWPFSVAAWPRVGHRIDCAEASSWASVIRATPPLRPRLPDFFGGDRRLVVRKWCSVGRLLSFLSAGTMPSLPDWSRCIPIGRG
jgi:hypothetical protein